MAGVKQGKKSRKSSGGKKDQDGGVGSGGLVPFNVLTNLTDGLKFPRLQESVFKVVQTRNISQALTSAQLTQGKAQVISTLTTQCTDNLSALTGLFDQYRFDCIEVWITPNQNALAQQIFATNPNLHSVIDYDDGTALAGIGAADAYSSHIRSEPYEKQRRCFKPRIAYAAYSGAFTSHANQSAGWIDCGSPDVEHYGIKLICEPDGNASGPHATWDVEVKAHLSFRSTH
jgi:hypothetical protein